MRKVTILVNSCLLTCLGLSAASLTPDQALQRLSNSIATRSATFADLKYASTIELSNGQPGLYIFENNSETGYAILSADDLAAPLLGYGNQSKLDSDSMSPDMKWWLEEYARQIEYARMTGAKPYENLLTRSDKGAISPLMSTKWNQNAPYNLMTPMVNGRHCVTGCVATAMAQVMKYWNYPETGKGTAECTVLYPDGTSGKEVMLLNEQNFDWNNMLDSYDGSATENQTSAVAYLMKACGYASNMGYSLYESGTAVFYAATSLMNNFAYNKNLQYCQRNYYGTSDWSDMIYEELEAGRPVVYGGQSNQAGHCFVCDGYDTDGYFHFNWGWGGMSDGYFLLDALNPGSLGIGANGGGYNFDQNIVIGIQPTEGKEYAPTLVQQGNMQGSITGITCKLIATGDYGGWHNMGTKLMTIDLGIKIEPINPAGETIYQEIMKDEMLAVNRYWPTLTFNMPLSLKNGKYRMTLCFRSSNAQEWTPVLCTSDCYNYIEFSKEGNKYTVYENKKALPEIVDAELLTPLYYGDALKMSVTVTNPSGKEITNFFYPALYSGGLPQMIAEGVAITLAPGETVTKEFICMFELLQGKAAPKKETEYRLFFYDPTSSENSNLNLDFYQGFFKDVTMKIDEFELDLTIEDFVIKCYDSYLQDGQYFYNVTDATSIPFSMKIINNADYFAKAIDLVIFPYISGQVTSLAIEPFAPFALLSKGESAELGVNVNFAAGEIGKSYFALPYIGYSPLGNERIYFTIGDYNGVESIEGDEIAIFFDKASSSLKLSDGVSGLYISAMDGRVYDKSSEAATGTVDLGNLAEGVYVVKATAQDGSVKTIKIIK